jgi:hypothetical protein
MAPATRARIDLQLSFWSHPKMRVSPTAFALAVGALSARPIARKLNPQLGNPRLSRCATRALQRFPFDSNR